MKKKKEAVLICKREYGRSKCKDVSGDNKLQLCDKHFNLQKEFLAENPSLLNAEKREIFGIDTPFLTKMNKKKKKKKKEDKDLPPDEHRCCRTNGIDWRCKNVKMWVDAAEEEDDNSNVRQTNYCRQHYTYHADKYAKNKKKRNGDGDEAEGADAGCTTNCSNKRKKKKKTVVPEDDRSGIQLPATTTNDTERTLAAASERWRKLFSELEKRRKKTVVAKGDRPLEDDLSFDQTGIQLATSCTGYSDESIEGGSPNIGTKRKTVERAECSGELESLSKTRDPVVELESLEHYKSECVKLALELEKKKEECTTLQGKLVELDTRMTTVTEESKRALADATECWRKMQSDLESRLLSMEKEKSTTAGSVESRNSKLESLNLRSRDNEMKWNSETDMLSSFEKDPELCTKAVCALYRQLISEYETSAKRYILDCDTPRVTELAEFLMDGDCNGDLKKSVKDLEIFDSQGIKDCKKLARRYSDPLFSVYQNGEDPCFLPPTTASSHGYQTSK